MSRADDLIVLRSNASAHNLKTALAQYNDKCKDLEIAVERLVCINSTNSEEYLKVLEEISKGREQLDKRETEASKYAPAEQRQIMTDNLSSESDKIKIRLDLKPEPLLNEDTPVE